MKRKWLLTSLIGVAALVVTACAAQPSAPSKASSENVAAEPVSLYEQIKTDGVMRFGTEGTYAPYTFHDAEGKLTGFDVEVAEEVAKRIGVKAEFIETKWDGMFAGLDSKRFDAVINQVTIRPDRLEKYDFSDPYIVSKAVLIVREDNETVKSFEDMKGIKSGQSLTSNLADLARSYGAEIVTVDSFNQALDLLTSKRIDSTINDSLSFLDYKKQRQDAPIKVVAEMDTKDENGILFNKGNETLVESVNKALAEMKADGTYQQISEKWFGADVSK